MAGISRDAYIAAIPSPPAVFEPDTPCWNNGITGSSFTHSGGSATYTASAFDTTKSITTGAVRHNSRKGNTNAVHVPRGREV